MTVEKYIISKLEETSKVISDVHFKYAYDKSTQFHIVEVSPNAVRFGNVVYAELECAIWSDFFKLYPDEDLLITEISKFNNMTNVIYETPLDIIFKSSDIKIENQIDYCFDISYSLETSIIAA